MRVVSGCLTLLVGCFSVSCSDEAEPPKANTATFASTAVCDSEALVDGTLPAKCAGTSTEGGPGLPYDFSGTVRHSRSLSPEQRAAIARANALAAARNPVSQSLVDRGFPPPKSPPGQAGSASTPQAPGTEP